MSSEELAQTKMRGVGDSGKGNGVRTSSDFFGIFRTSGDEESETYLVGERVFGIVF